MNMIQFKDLKKGYQVYILDTQKVEIHNAEITADPTPRNDIMKQLGQATDYDITARYAGTERTFSIPGTLSIAYSSGIAITTEKSLLKNEVSVIESQAKAAIDNVEHERERYKNAKELIKELDPSVRERVEMENRMSKIEETQRKQIETQNEILNILKTKL